MNQKSLNPNLVAAILIAFTGLFLAILPFRLEIVPNISSAQSTPSTTVEYTLRTVIGQTPPMAFVGVGGDIDGVVNPPLKANVGDTVKITVINGDPVLHDLTIDEFGVTTGQLTELDQQAVIEFVANQGGEFKYYCATPGHRQVGMEGSLSIAGETPMENMNMQTVALQPTAAPANPDAVSVIRDPADVPASVGSREAQNVRIDLTAQEVVGQLADGTTFDYFTFDGQIPGPMLRVRVGDTVELHLKNPDGSLFPHSIDLHAVTGPGGGAVYTQTNPGGETFFTFQALNPGLYVYHCATPSVAHHIANGMYGLILVEPEGGLPPVSKEFYVMQGEIYTAESFGTQGHLTFSHEKMLDEDAEYLVFNGASMALTQDDYALRVNVDDTVRIFFGVGGPNYTSSFHVIGEIFDRVYNQASLTSDPLTNVQTTSVAPGGATMVEFKVEVPGRYILVDHALARLERGLAGYLYVEGEDNPTVFHGDEPTAGSGH
jgi:nitrite reductase (NO-forming)